MRCEFCGQKIINNMSITTPVGEKCFDCMTKEISSFNSGMVNCGNCTAQVHHTELIHIPELNRDVCENCFNTLKNEKPRRN